MFLGVCINGHAPECPLDLEMLSPCRYNRAFRGGNLGIPVQETINEHRQGGSVGSSLGYCRVR